MPGVELQAAAIATMFRDAPVRDTGQLVDVLAIVLVAGLGAAAALVPLRFSVVAIVAVAFLFLASRSTCSRSQTGSSPWPRRCSPWRSRSSASWRSTPSAPRAGTPGVNTTPAAGLSDPAGASARAH